MDRFVFEIVDGPDVAHGATAGTHEDRMGDGFVADEFHSGEEGAFNDSSGTEDRTFSGDNIGGTEKGLNFLFRDSLNLAGFGLGVGEPHAELDIASQGTDCGRGQNTFGGSSDADIKVDS